MAELATVKVDVQNLEVVKDLLRKQNLRIAELEVAIGKYELTRTNRDMFALFDLVEQY